MSLGRGTSSDHRRDARYDIARGLAIAVVVITHSGLSGSWLTTITGNGQYAVNGAEVFFAVSGATLGLVASRRPFAVSRRSLLRRTALLWIVVVAVTALAELVASPLGGLAVPDVATALRIIGSSALLQQTAFYADVLVTYVLYLALAVPAVRLLADGRWPVVVGATAAAWLLRQVLPADVLVPVASFRDPLANAPVFFLPLVLSWHREAVAAVAGRRAGLRRWSLAGAVAVVAAVFVAYVTDFRVLPWLSEPLGYAIGDEGGTALRATTMPPATVLVVAAHLAVGWRLLTRFERVVAPVLRPAVEPLGRASLFAFAIHGFVIGAWELLPGFPGTAATPAVQTAWVVVLLVGMWVVCHARNVLRRRALDGELAVVQPSRPQRVPYVLAGSLVVLSLSAAVALDIVDHPQVDHPQVAQDAPGAPLQLDAPDDEGPTGS